MLTQVRVSLPPMIATLIPPTASERDLARARFEATDLESVADGVLSPLAGFLIRMESVASSRIEHVEATPLAFARAIGGLKENTSATSMVAAGAAITRLIDASSDSIRMEEILAAHEALMRTDPDPAERRYAGRLRDMQNWIGGSAHSPRNAIYVPPPPETVAGSLDDLITFANRDDVEPITQAAIAHAHFESIHPFTDGNGRIGRALIGAILRRRGVTPHTVLPVASALAADTGHYFSLLTSYRSGDALPIITDLALSVEVAAREARGTARAFGAYEDAWRHQLRPRAESAADRILPALLALPVFTVEQLAAATGIAERSAYRAVETLTEHHVVEAVTERVRGRTYAAMDILDEFEDLDGRIRERITRLREA
ncbi:Adenosine monophosphate-protein transferase SoFic [Frondihabitans sp. 762G35]|uniref:Fic family protein n=1 Tax=Frondihabitans sp. 762G35 TaxID=1446794 RepID=UPI000D22B67F|nr:Fic family protein [Frondihabitans sp. 762G35]ARC55618.1 Adenosine monophosphate-protein transferase SoFic [Frondihabitans sp. 762G35]